MLKKSYIPFYLEGREARQLAHSIDVVALAHEVLDTGASPLEVSQVAAQAAAEPYRKGRRRSSWVSQSSDEIADAGGSTEDAYGHYLQGRIDELAVEIEAMVCEALEDDLGVEAVEIPDKDPDGDPEGDDDDDD